MASLAYLHQKKYHTFLLRSVIIVVAACIVLSMLIPKGKDVILINGLNTPFLDWFFATITNLGDGLVAIPILVICLFIRYSHAIILTGICIVNGLLVSLLKRVLYVNAGRPISILNNDLLHFVSGINVHSAHSFPSGHTATGFALAIFVALLFRNKTLTIVLLVLAATIGYSRIYLLQHFLLDVAAGTLIGSFSALSVYYLCERTPWPTWATKRLKFRKQSKIEKYLPSGREAT